MGTVTRARIIKIGNSQGIRIPKLILEQVGLGEEVELEAQEHQLVIRAARHPRDGWEEQFMLMAESEEDKLLDGDIPGLTNWDETEWEW